jgi:hypothetical protein
MLTAARTLSAAKLKIGMTVLVKGSPLKIIGKAVVKSELHGLNGTTAEADKVWLWFSCRPKLELDPKDRLGVVE